MKTNQDYKNDALDALKGNWAPALLATAIFFIIEGIISGPNAYQSMQQSALTAAGTPALSPWMALDLLQIFIILPLALGFSNAMLALVRSGERNITANMFKLGFCPYWKKAWGMILMMVFIFLWSLLFFIPGLIKAYSYAMTPYILNDNPDLSANEAIDRSRAMMKGHKFDLFYLHLSFIGWFLLCILSCGIGFLWLVPYVQGSVASFYEDRLEEWN
ncbi:MAG: DUF975 family protein [Bacteroidales bacterium]|nr:DUF975 family protein [Bacteroidales bacterium]